MQSKQDVLDRIKSDPEGTLKDIETLRTELATDRLILKGKESLIRYFAAIAEDQWVKYHETRKALVRARILVATLKSAVQDAQGAAHSD